MISDIYISSSRSFISVRMQNHLVLQGFRCYVHKTTSFPQTCRSIIIRDRIFVFSKQMWIFQQLKTKSNLAPHLNWSCAHTVWWDYDGYQTENNDRYNVYMWDDMIRLCAFALQDLSLSVLALRFKIGQVHCRSTAAWTDAAARYPFLLIVKGFGSRDAPVSELPSIPLLRMG